VRLGRLSGAGLAGLAPSHHHLFIAQQRAAQNPGLDLLSPRKPEGKDALVRRINERHQRRRDAIKSRFRTAQKSQPP